MSTIEPRVERLIQLDTQENEIIFDEQKKSYIKFTCFMCFNLFLIFIFLASFMMILISLVYLLKIMFQNNEINERTRIIIDNSIFIDGNNNLPFTFKIFENFNIKKNLTLNFYNENEKNILSNYYSNHENPMTDLTNLKISNLGVVLFKINIPCNNNTVFSNDLTFEIIKQIELIKSLELNYNLKLVKNTNEMFDNFNQRKISIGIALSGGHCLKDSLSLLKLLRSLNVLYFTLTPNKCSTSWIECEADLNPSIQFNQFTKDVIDVMNKDGVIIDLTHASFRFMDLILKYTKTPIMFSHSNAYGICKNTKNVPSIILDQLKINNGIIMITLNPILISDEANNLFNTYLLEFNDNKLKAHNKLQEWIDLNPHKMNSTHLVDHIEFITDRIGIDHIGISSNFENFNSYPFDLRNSSQLTTNIVRELLIRNYDDEEIKKIIGGNFIRVMDTVQNYKK